MNWRAKLALLCAALVLAVPASAAVVQEAVTRNLVLSSVVVRQAYEQRAAAEQFATFQKLAETETRLRAALGDAKTSKAEAAKLRAQLGEVQVQLQQAITDLAAKDRDFAIRVAALEGEMRGVVSVASPAKLSLLERFANGDRKGAYAAIEELTYAENRAREIATAKAEAANLKGLLPLKAEMIARGEASLSDMSKVWQDIVRLDPDDTESAMSLIGNLASLRRFEEAADLIDVVEGRITEPWARLEFEGKAIETRVSVRGFQAATAPFFKAASAVEKLKPLAQMEGEERLKYCGATLNFFVSAPLIFDRKSEFLGIIGSCLENLSKDPRYVFSAINAAIVLNRNLLLQRDEQIYEKTLPTLLGVREKIASLEDYKSMRDALVFDLTEVLIAGHVEAGEPIPANLVIKPEDVLTTIKMATGMFGNSQTVSYTGQIVSDYGFVQHYIGKPLLAREAFELLLSAPEPPDPASSRGDIAGYLGRAQWSTRLADVCLDMMDLSCAAKVLDKARPFLARLQVLRPLDDGEMFMVNTRDVYVALMEASLSAARLRLEQGSLAEADARLLGVMDKLAPFMKVVWMQPPWLPFQVQALLLSGEIRGQQGQADGARAQLQAALKLAQDAAVTEQKSFRWTTAQLQARFRLAQLDGNATELAAVRAEQAALVKAGKQFDRHAAWLRDLATWKPGKPVHWRNAAFM